MRDSPASRPMHPGWYVPMALVGGLATAGPAAGAALVRLGYRKRGWLLGSTLGMLGLLLFAFGIVWSVEWFWAALLLAGVHLASGVALFFVLRKPYLAHAAENPPQPREGGSYREIIAGIVGGTAVGGLMGLASMVLYLLLMDRLLSTSFPVVFDDSYAAFRVFSGAFVLAASSGIAGGFLGRFYPRAGAGQLILCGLGLIWAHLTWLAAVEGMIAVPGFQAGAATGQGWDSVMAPLFFGHFLVGTWWPIFLLFFMIAPEGRVARLKRAALVVGMNLAAGVVLTVSLGHTVNVFLALGRYLERRAYTAPALRCYELGLRKEPSEQVASYLQFQAALLSHKLGNREQAERGFGRVVAKYTADQELVKRADRFLDSLKRAPGGKRVLLPGVETRTEYRSSYCVPNSLALAMHYWGAHVSARAIGERITGLSSGTFAVTQKWFAEQEGFRHEFLPLADLDDVKRCIDAGFPVMVYVPAHVFVVVGYDDALETFVTYDVATQDVWVDYIQKDFIKSWKRQATTLVLAFPPEKEGLLPDDVRRRMGRLSDRYLHLQLQYFDTQGGGVSIPHLREAAGEKGELFLPVTMLFSAFPGLRKGISEQYDATLVAAAIDTYFRDDYDEGAHLWGQYHDQRSSWPDSALQLSLEYLMGQGRFDLIQELATRIDDEGQLSDAVLADVGVLDLARGRLRQGLDRLERADESDRALYQGLALLKAKDSQGAVRKLAAVMPGGT